jgi:23S rRNA pseudouridine2605 synthase
MSDEARPDATPSEPESPETEAAEAEETLAAAAADTEEQAAEDESALIVAETDDAAEADHDMEPGDAESGPAPKLERLQKILAQAGVASRRHAENLITEGRVQVNGKVITELGTKADAARDHIRVDGKLLQGSERLRYYMLNKPRGFVTTVSDPEKRPTVMEFFTKLRERLYPVGRLDYLSEGLLLVTNDGDLANKLTRAAAGVEKTYLVKVSGEPTEESLDRLRSGVGIERGKPGSGRVQTAPAQIRKVRQGDNPWYEVVIIEGRNRELRKMFEEIGHHVEKIRRLGTGREARREKRQGRKSSECGTAAEQGHRRLW